MPRLGLGLGLGSLIGRPSVGGGSVPPVVPFSPDQLAGLIEWFEPETGVYSTESTLAQVGESVLRWTNKVTGQPNAEQSNANLQPVYQEDYRGKYLDFPSTDVLTIVRGSGVFVNPPLTYYAVANFGQATSYLINRASSTISPRNALLRTSGVLALRQSTQVTSSLTVNNECVVCGVLEGGGIGLVGRKDSGDYEEQSLTGLGTATSSNITSCLGAGTTSGTSSMSRIYEFLAYNQAHSQEDRLKVINYLQQKYSL